MVRPVGQSLTVGKPRGVELIAALRSDARGPAPNRVQNPDVGVLAVGRIADRGGDAPAVRGDANVLVACDRAERAELAPFAIHPHEPSPRGPELITPRGSRPRRPTDGCPRPVPDVLEDGAGIADQPEAGRVEPPRDQRVVPRKEQVAGVGVDRRGVRPEQRSYVLPIDGTEHDRGLLRIAITRDEDEVPPVGEKGRVEVPDIAALRRGPSPDGGCRRRPEPRRCRSRTPA